jgi:hypothetical protein
VICSGNGCPRYAGVVDRSFRAERSRGARLSDAATFVDPGVAPELIAAGEARTIQRRLS